MAIGVRIGSPTNVGVLVGNRIGATRGGGSSAIPGVARDATSLWYRPATNAQWSTFLAAIGAVAGAPTSIWLCQDASAGLVDVNGTNNLSEFGSVLYNQTVTGHAAKGVGFADASVGAEFASVAASLPDVLTDDVLVIWAVAFTGAPAASRTLFGLGSTSYQVRVSTTPTYTVFAGANNAAGASNLGTALRPHALRHNRTAGTVLYATDQEKSEPTFDPAVTGKRVDFGGFDQAAPGVLATYGVMFTGAAARRSNADVKTILGGITGTAPPWAP